MQEQSVINLFVKKKNHSIPRGVFYWIFFKKHLLENEDLKKHFDQQDLDVQQFRKTVREKISLAKYGPSFVAGKKLPKETKERNEREMLSVLYVYYYALLHPTSRIYVKKSTMSGLGLFTKDIITVSLSQKTFLPSHLFGVFFITELEDFKILKTNKYPSLFDDGKICGIITGPLSLVNHHCKTPFGFTYPGKIHIEEFQAISGIYCKPIKNGKIDSNSELTVCYNKIPNPTDEFTCYCSECCEQERQNIKKRKSFTIRTQSIKKRRMNDEME
mmetsp:Transcript_27117/g.38180  ORF Transcript_27117/g.38180 Transcript_27117/m.38180 type:complete len:273 (-) Transcript_27117:13-831(-)